MSEVGKIEGGCTCATNLSCWFDYLRGGGGGGRNNGVLGGANAQGE